MRLAVTVSSKVNAKQVLRFATSKDTGVQGSLKDVSQRASRWLE